MKYGKQSEKLYLLIKPWCYNNYKYIIAICYKYIIAICAIRLQQIEIQKDLPERQASSDVYQAEGTQSFGQAFQDVEEQGPKCLPD